MSKPLPSNLVRPTSLQRESRFRGTSRVGPTPRALSTALVSLVMLAFALCLAPAPAAAQMAQRPDTVTLVAHGVPHQFTAEVADTPGSQARGLMFRESMPADHGMLFDFGSERPVAFWMKNTPLSLDMIFARANGDIVKIARDTTPFSEASIPSGGPVRFVFEVNAGTADRIGLQPGDRLLNARVQPGR